MHRLRRKRSSPRFDSGPNNRMNLTALRAARYPEAFGGHGAASDCACPMRSNDTWRGKHMRRQEFIVNRRLTRPYAVEVTLASP